MNIYKLNKISSIKDIKSIIEEIEKEYGDNVKLEICNNYYEESKYYYKQEDVTLRIKNNNY